MSCLIKLGLNVNSLVIFEGRYNTLKMFLLFFIFVRIIFLPRISIHWRFHFYLKHGFLLFFSLCPIQSKYFVTKYTLRGFKHTTKEMEGDAICNETSVANGRDKKSGAFYQEIYKNYEIFLK